jgi:hypothetical protein
MVKQYVVHPYHVILLNNKGNKPLIHAKIWMDSKGVTMSEDRQYQKVTFWLGVVTCNCSPSYLGEKDWNTHGSKSAQEKVRKTPISTNKLSVVEHTLFLSS